MFKYRIFISNNLNYLTYLYLCEEVFIKSSAKITLFNNYNVNITRQIFTHYLILNIPMNNIRLNYSTFINIISLYRSITA